MQGWNQVEVTSMETERSIRRLANTQVVMLGVKEEDERDEWK